MAKLSLIVDSSGNRMATGGQHYEGATSAPRSVGWNAPSSGPNRALAAAGATLRNRSRAGYRNSALLHSAINKGVTAEAGKGVTILSTCKNEAVRQTLNELWRETQCQLDPWEDQHFGGMISQIVRARKMSGEVFIKRVPVRLGMGLRVPFQIEVLESDFCPINYSTRLPGKNKRISQGVEFHGRKKVAYWFYKVHPSDLDPGIDAHVGALVRVPARDVIHHYNPTRPGQIRGEPDTSAALLKDREFADYSDAELRRKTTRAGFTGFLYREEYSEEDDRFDAVTGQPLHEDDTEVSQQIEVVQGGTILRGQQGEKLQLFEGDNTGAGFGEFMKAQSRQIAASLDIPYPLLTGDWEGLSDRTIRAILNEYRRGVTADQTNLLGFQVCLKVWRWFVDTCVMMGYIPAAGFADNPWSFYALDIRPDAWRHLHPEQDIRSRSMAINNLFSNPEKEAAECGADLEENMRATARSVRKWREACIAEGLDPDKIGIFGGNKNNSEEGD